MPKRKSLKIGLQSIAEAQQLFGQRDSFLRRIEADMSARVLLRSDYLEVVGEDGDVDEVAEIVNNLLGITRSGSALTMSDVQTAVQNARRIRSLPGETPPASPEAAPETGDAATGGNALSALAIHAKQGPIRPRSKNQSLYIEAMRSQDLVFGVGPAGTGKTYLAMAMAASALKSGAVDRIMMTRPAVEAGEKLGFLPGDIQAKIDPYLRPLYDALYDMFPVNVISQYVERGVIEIAPLAFMRGRTLNRAFVVLDEAQNATIPQMKMFLTRLGFDSKAVVTGDATQSDLPDGAPSGLVHALGVLKRIDGIGFVEFSSADVVRHALVQRIVEAYDASSRSMDKAKPAAGAPSEWNDLG